MGSSGLGANPPAGECGVKNQVSWAVSYKFIFVMVKVNLPMKNNTKTFVEKVYFFVFLRYNVILGALLLSTP